MQDFEIRSSAGDELPEQPSGSGGRGTLIAVSLLLLTALVGGGYFLYSVFSSGGGAPPEQTAVSAAPAAPTPPTPEPPAAEAPAPEAFSLPRLDDSDETVRTLAVSLSRHPRLASWLANDELIRRFVLVVANVAYGEPPRNHVRFLAPDGRFVVERSGEELRVDPQSYMRYDVLTEVFVSLDESGLAELYHRLHPLLEQAYGELGYPDPDFDHLLHQAVGELLEVPIVEPELQVKPRVISYELVDPELEALSDPQKQLLRMGPTNVRRIQDKLRRLDRLLDLG